MKKLEDGGNAAAAATSFRPNGANENSPGQGETASAALGSQSRYMKSPARAAETPARSPAATSCTNPGTKNPQAPKAAPYSATHRRSRVRGGRALIVFGRRVTPHSEVSAPRVM